jgi:hypothetical protein
MGNGVNHCQVAFMSFLLPLIPSSPHFHPFHRLSPC